MTLGGIECHYYCAKLMKFIYILLGSIDKTKLCHFDRKLPEVSAGFFQRAMAVWHCMK